MTRTETVRVALAGDVMLGRGVDQIMRNPVDPALHERSVGSALGYVELAEQRSGPIPRGVGPDYVWGEALPLLRRIDPDATIVNLETAVTDDGLPWPGKGIHYRMHPDHLDTLVAAGVEVAILANNHALDWSRIGLEETLDALDAVGILSVGAGRTEEEAWAPAVIPHRHGGRILVWAVGSTTSGIPAEWAATGRRPGIALLPDLTPETARRLGRRIAPVARSGDIVVVSIHWGPNWGYRVSPRQRQFARSLVHQAGAHVVHGHSSHHPLGIEIHEGRLILYGCGDLVTDYEGISGHEEFRGELGMVWSPRIEPKSGSLVGLDLLPTAMRRFRLTVPSPAERQWLAGMLIRESAVLDTAIGVEGDRVLTVSW